jgi:hypothetical protein
MHNEEKWRNLEIPKGPAPTDAVNEIRRSSEQDTRSHAADSKEPPRTE